MQTIPFIPSPRHTARWAATAAVTAFCFRICIANAQSQPLTLDEAVDTALTQAPQIAASTAALESMTLVAPSAGRLPDPELIGGVDNLPVDTADRFSLTRDFMTMRRIGVMQSFPNHSKRHLQSERAERDVALARAELAKTRFETARDTADAWIALAVADQSLGRLRSLQADMKTYAASGRGGLASGRASLSEALAAQGIAARWHQRTLSLQQDAEISRAELIRWIGEDANRPLAAIPADRELTHQGEALIAAVPQHAPLAPLAAQVALAKTEVQLARAQRRPDWSTELSYAQRGPDFSNMVSLEFRVGLPLFAAQRQNPVIAGKLATLRAEEARRDAEIRMHTAEVQGVLASWRLGRTRLQRYDEELLPLARDRAHALAASYGAGRGDLRQAIEGLSEEVDDELAYFNLQGAVARAWVFLHLLHDAGSSDAESPDRGATP